MPCVIKRGLFTRSFFNVGSGYLPTHNILLKGSLALVAQIIFDGTIRCL